MRSSNDDAWVAAPGRQHNKRSQNARPQAMSERPYGMSKTSPVMQTKGSNARTSPGAPGSGNTTLSQKGSRDAVRQQPVQAPSYSVLAEEADDEPQHNTASRLDQQSPHHSKTATTTTTPAALDAGALSSKRKLSAQEAAIPHDTVEKLLAAARAMYQQNMGVKTAAKQFNVTVQGLRHFWDTNGGSEICRSQAPKARPGHANSSSPAAPSAQSSGTACPYYADEDDDDQWY